MRTEKISVTSNTWKTSDGFTSWNRRTEVMLTVTANYVHICYPNSEGEYRVQSLPGVNTVNVCDQQCVVYERNIECATDLGLPHPSKW